MNPESGLGECDQCTESCRWRGEGALRLFVNGGDNPLMPESGFSCMVVKAKRTSFGVELIHTDKDPGPRLAICPITNVCHDQ